MTDINLDADCNTVQAIHVRQVDKDVIIRIKETDLVFVTNGSMTQNHSFGDNHTAAITDKSADNYVVFAINTY